MTDFYNPRNWAIERLPLEGVQPPLEDSDIPWAHVVGMDTSAAESILQRGGQPFYYDFEQVAAGLDEVFGARSLHRLAEDYVAPSGATYNKGALVLFLTDINTDDFTRGTLFEQI